MTPKPLYTIDDLRTIILALGIAIFILVSEMWILKLEDEKAKYTAAMNAYADLYCQDQSYVVENRTLVTDFSNPNATYYFCQYWNFGWSDKQDCFEVTYKDAILRNEFWINSIFFVNDETHHYPTGIYRANESKIECLGEPNTNRVGLGGSQCTRTTLLEIGAYQKSQKFEVPKM